MPTAFAERRLVPEIMDQPDLEADRHARALAGLARINFFSGSDRIVWRAIQPLFGQGRVVRLLDVATGGGDVAIRLWRRARNARCNLEIVGADVSATALDVARRRAAQAEADVSFVRLDALNDDWPTGFDVVTSSLFLHHLARDEASAFLRKMRADAGQMALVNDLRRCRLGYSAAWLASRMLTTSRIIHVDAPRSVAAAFTLDEVRRLADEAAWVGATIDRRWPWRFLLQWNRPR